MLNVFASIAINLAAVFVLFVARLLGFDLLARLIRFQRRVGLNLRRMLRKRRTVLLYTDYDEDGQIVRRLEAALDAAFAAAGELLRVQHVVDPNQLLRWPLPRRSVQGVVLLLTDVTQLATSPKDRRTLHAKLKKFVQRGGVLVVGHDVIWRRSRNEELQRLCGGRLARFHPRDAPIEYAPVAVPTRVTRNDALRAVLQTTPFFLDDAEVLEGEWEDDVEFLYVWSENPAIPLVTRRTVHEGSVFWVNSGDRNQSKHSPASIGQAQPDFVKLLADMLTHG